MQTMKKLGLTLVLVVAGLWLAAMPVGASTHPCAAHLDTIREWRNDPQWVSHSSHTDRWDRVLKACGETVTADVTAMTAAEAQGFYDRTSAAGKTRWGRIVTMLTAVEQQAQTVVVAPQPTPTPIVVSQQAVEQQSVPAARARSQRSQVVRKYSLQLIGYDFTSYNRHIRKDLPEGGVYDYRLRVNDEFLQGNHPAVCLDLPDPARFSVNVDGLDGNGCVLADRWNTTWQDANVRVWGVSVDDNRVGPDVVTHTIRLQASSAYTIDDLSHNVEMRVAEDDAGSITLGREAGRLGFRVWRTLEGSPAWSLQYDIRGAGWTEAGTSLAGVSQRSWSPDGTTGTVLQQGFTPMAGFVGTLGTLGMDCSRGPAEMRLGHVERGGRNLSARTPGTAGYVAVHPAHQWVNVCPPPSAKATALLRYMQHYRCDGRDLPMGEQWFRVEWTTTGAAANGIAIGVSKNLGLGNGVYRSNATRINLAVGGLSAPQIAAMVNGKTTFQNDGRPNPIRITAHSEATPGWKTVDGDCEMTEAFLGFDVSSQTAAFSGGRD